VRYEFLIAARYLRARRRDAFISVTTMFTAVGVMLGVAALIIVLAVMSGFEKSLRDRILSLTPQIQVESVAGGIADYADLQKRIAQVPGVAGTDPFIVGQGMASAARGLSGVIVRGVDVTNPIIRARFHGFVQQGSMADLARNAAGGDGTAAIGSTLADKLNARVGDQINLVIPLMAGRGLELTTRTGHFRIAAIFETGVILVDRDVLFLGLRQAQDFFGRPGRVDGIEVRLDNLDDTGVVSRQLRQLLGADFRLTTWMDYDQAAAAGFAFLKRVYAIVLLMLIAVAAFNLIATLIMVVLEKRKDIAVLMAMGAGRADIRRIFVLKGLIVGSAGTAAGLLMGALGCFLLAHYHFIHIEKKIYGIPTLPVDAHATSFVIVAAASIALCGLAALYPARQAANQLPVTIFRS